MSSAPNHIEAAAPVATPEEIDASCRVPLLVLFGSSAAWLVISSILAFIASVKMHMPTLMADCPFFTYGHVQGAAFNTLLYGFIVQAAAGVMLWLIARLGRTTLSQGGFAAVGGIFWNLGVTLGLIGIMIGDGTGYEWFEFPKYAAAVLFAGYVLIGMVGGFTFAERKTEEMYPSQWFLLAALFWFPWIYATALALIHWFPTMGVMQAVVHQWYAHNLVTIWLGCIGIAAAFYFVPKLAAKPLANRSYALVTFWLLLMFGSIGGMHHGMPVPAWLPALSTVMAFLTVVPILAFAFNIHATLDSDYASWSSSVTQKFMVAGSLALLAGILMKAIGSVPEISDILQFTYFTAAQSKLILMGFASLILLGAIYYIIPQVTGVNWPFPRLAKLHFVLALISVIFLVLALGFAGWIQGSKLSSEADFMDVTLTSLKFFRASTLGDLLWMFGGLFLLVNVKVLLYRMAKAQALACINDSKAKTREATV
ncbi:MAG: rane protein [Verrucomicrobia bacterium]|jgi:cytochrome c oxidase cbb3-type subunit 1|nr:rane protein [Verrucomicrobiota bacterium]